MVSKKRKTIITKNKALRFKPAPVAEGSHLDQGHLEQPSHFGTTPQQPETVAIRSVALQRLSEALATLAKKKFSKREAGPSDAPHHLTPSMFKFLPKLTVRRLTPRKGTIDCTAADWWDAMTGTLFDVARRTALVSSREDVVHCIVSWSNLAATGRRVEDVGASVHKDGIYYRLATAWKHGWLSGQGEQQKQIMAKIQANDAKAKISKANDAKANDAKAKKRKGRK